jgi:hypothetical protein
MDNYPFNTVGLCSEDIDRYNDIYKALKTKFNIELTGHIDFHLEQFELFKNYISVDLLGSFVIKHQNCDSYIFFIQTNYKVTPAKGVGSYYANDCQIWALAYLKKDFGGVLIRRETLTDKIIELIHPVELDFAEDKAFSDTFYVLVNDRDKAASAIDRNFRNAVMDIRHEDLLIEIVEHSLIIGNQEPISLEKSIHLAEFVARVASIC